MAITPYIPKVPFEFYKEVFNAGLETQITEQEFPRAEQRAWQRANWRNYPIAQWQDADGTVFEPVAKMICAVAEWLHARNTLQVAVLENNGIVEERNFQHSYKIHAPQMTEDTAKIEQSELNAIIQRYLFGTEYWNDFGYLGGITA